MGHLDEHEAYISTDNQHNVASFDNSVNFDAVTRFNEIDILTKPSDPANQTRITKVKGHIKLNNNAKKAGNEFQKNIAQILQS